MKKRNRYQINQTQLSVMKPKVVKSNKNLETTSFPTIDGRSTPENIFEELAINKASFMLTELT